MPIPKNQVGTRNGASFADTRPRPTWHSRDWSPLARVGHQGFWALEHPPARAGSRLSRHSGFGRRSFPLRCIGAEEETDSRVAAPALRDWPTEMMIHSRHRAAPSRLLVAGHRDHVSLFGAFLARNCGLGCRGLEILFSLGLRLIDGCAKALFAVGALYLASGLGLALAR